MRRFFVGPKDIELGQSTHLTGDEFHHLKNVCRLEEGECVELLDGQGFIAVARILKIGKKDAELTVESVEKLPPPANPTVDIVLCIPRFQKMDFIIQKAVELGAGRLLPVVSDRSFIKTLSKDINSKKGRWEKIALEACKQSGRAWPMIIEDFQTLEDALQNVTPQESLFLYEGETAQDIKTALSTFHNLEKITLFIGAEGGFSTTEVQGFIEKGFKPVTLGPLVLRVETACIAILSVIQYHFNLMR